MPVMCNYQMKTDITYFYEVAFYFAVLFADSLLHVCFVFNTRMGLIRQLTKFAGHA